ncbi:MAG: peptidoglycan-binding domain-containing protein [Candidatus Paceibacterota bacterium]|jgi:hypothetical protein
MKTKLIISLTLILAGFANLVMASEITGILSTGLNGNVNQTLTGTVIVPVIPPVSSGGGSRGGGGGGYVKPLVINASTTTASTTLQLLPRVLGASTYRFARLLRLGSSGDDVKELQERLRTEGFFKYPVSTGYFGTLTKTALIAYQKKNKMSRTGVLSLRVMDKLNYK